MNKQELEAENRRLAEENKALRDLLSAVVTMADAPRPAGYSDRYYWACTDRLSTIKVWAELDEPATGPNAALNIRTYAKGLRERAAEPVRYEVRAAEPEPAPLPDVTASCECAHPNSLHGPEGCLRPDCGCATFRPRTTASTPEPPHVVPGEVVDGRPSLRIGGNLVPLGGQS